MLGILFLGAHEHGRKEGINMVRLTLLLGVAVLALVCVTGCFNYDPVHNQYHWAIMRADFQAIHEDIDFMTGFDGPTHLRRSDY
jgi:hypothetical protein